MIFLASVSEELKNSQSSRKSTVISFFRRVDEEVDHGDVQQVLSLPLNH
jgi:hypothetical protein